MAASRTRPADWIARYYERFDDRDMDGAMSFWAPDGVLRFANAEPVVGRDAVRAQSEELQRSFAEMSHEVLDVWAPAHDVAVFEARVSFTRFDGGGATVKGAAICRTDDERFVEQRIYVDLAPVFEGARA